VEFFCNNVSWDQQTVQALFTHTCPPPPLKVKSFKILKLKITYPHCCIKKPPLLHIHIRNTSGAVHQPAAIYEPKSSRPVKLSIFTHCVTEGAYRYVTVDAAMECAIYSFEI